MKRSGEFELIHALLAELPHPRAPFGPGDDAAVLPPSREPQCVTTDAVVEGVHFTRPEFSLADVGHKALAVNLSDLAAMGARPSWWVCALGLPVGFDKRQVVGLARGMAPQARRFGLQLVGGNVTASPVLTVTITLAGRVKKPLLRSGAKAGELLYVSGTLGAAAAGLSMLRKPRPDRGLVAAQKRPTPQVELGLRATRFASAAIDVSDGLLADLSHLCEASGVGVALESARIPLAAGLARFAPSQALEWALHGGEDYQLLFAVPPRRAREFERMAASLRVGVTQLGVFRTKAGLTLDGAPATARGFNHFGNSVRL